MECVGWITEWREEEEKEEKQAKTLKLLTSRYTRFFCRITIETIEAKSTEAPMKT